MRSNTRANAMIAMDVVGLLFGLLSMLLLGYLRARYPDAISEGVFTALLTQLSTLTAVFALCLRDAHQFEFGSSRGSKEKSEERERVVERLTQGPQQGPAQPLQQEEKP